MHYKNNYSPTSSQACSTYPQYLTMMLSQVPTSATTWRFAVRIGTASRYTSGGSSLVPVNVNGNSANTSPSICYFGAVVTALDTQNRLVANGTVGSVIPVTLDVWTFTFGDTSIPTNFLNGSASAKNVTIPLPPVIVPPGGYMQVEMWGASNAAAPSWEFTMGVVERPAGQ
jgi:putative component of membrane protein insertase Oxa1/YidC/SpoIIIJ protein YidD